jgi:hypothetical protein
MTEPQPATVAEVDERVRRLQDDAADARAAVNWARARYDAICNELRNLRHLRREMEK